MGQARNILTEVQAATRHQWFESGKWLAAVVIGSLLPLWGGYLLLLLFNQQVSLSNFASNGEFALYSAAFLMPAFHLVGRDLRNTFVHRQIFLLAGILMLIMSVLLFAAATAATTGVSVGAQIGDFQLNVTRLISWSLVLLTLSLIFAFLVNLLDNILMGFDPSFDAAKDRKSLSEAFRATGDDNAS